MVKRKKIENPYKKETALCADFMRVAEEHGWSAYPETGGFDILLVATDTVIGFPVGTQIGVQAKLQGNLQVLAQSVASFYRHEKGCGPQYVGVLVPGATPEFRSICEHAGFFVYSAVKPSALSPNFVRPVSNMGILAMRPEDARQTPHTKPLVLPPKVVMPAGLPSPRSVTTWKSAAVRLCLHGVKQGYLTSADFQRFELSMTNWLKKRTQWITPTGFMKHNGRRIRIYSLNEAQKPPHILYPEIAEAIRKEST